MTARPTPEGEGAAGVARAARAAECGARRTARAARVARRRWAALVWCGVLLAGCGGESGEPLTQPVPMGERNPVEYPVSLWDQRLEGETVLLVHVNEYGDVDSAYVDRSSGQAAFDSAAVAGARRLRFTPGKRGDSHIAMWTRLPVRFSLDSTATLGVTVPLQPESESP